MNGRSISFGLFRFVAAQRLLLEGDEPVRRSGVPVPANLFFSVRWSDCSGQLVAGSKCSARIWPTSTATR